MSSQIFVTRASIAALVVLSGVPAIGCVLGFPAGRRPVTEVTIAGAEQLDEDDIADGLANHPPRGLVFREVAPYDALALEVDRRRIESFYRTHGFFSAEVMEADVDVADEADPESDVRIRYAVVEGPPSTLASVDVVSTSTAVPIADLEEASSLVAGERFEYAEYERTKAAMLALLELRGHPRGSVEGRVAVDRDRRTVAVELVVSPGPEVHFDRVRVDSASVPASAVENRVAWAAGDRYDPAKIEITEGRLYTLGLVGSVRFTPTYHHGDTKMDVAIELSETSRNELRLGFGLQIDEANYTLAPRATYVRRYFFDPLTSLRLDFRPALRIFPGDAVVGVQIEAAAEVIRDDFLYPRLQLTTGVSYRLVTFEAYTTQSPTARVVVGRPFLDDRLKLSASANASLVYVDAEAFVLKELYEIYGIYEGGLPLFFAIPSATYDGRDNPLSPHAGWLVSLPLEVGKLFREGGSFYLKLTPELQGYLPIFTPRVVLAGRIRVGGNVLQRPLPITQRYFIGGSDTHRGFNRRRLSPGLQNEGSWVPLGAEAAYVANAELRVEIVRVFGEWFGAVAFADLGDAANGFAELDVSKPHVAVGGGLRYHTPVGPIRFDVGFRLNRYGPGEIAPAAYDDLGGRFAFHISIGEAF